MSRLHVSRGDQVKLWANTARLQAAAGKPELSAQSRDTSLRVRALNKWLRDKRVRGREVHW